MKITPTFQTIQATDTLEKDALLTALLAELFFHNPDEKLLNSIRLIEAEDFEQSSIRETLERLRDAAQCEKADEESKILDLKRDWTKLFRGISPVYGPTAPYALLYFKRNMNEAMSDMTALYLDGGYDQFQNVQDRVDYIGTGFHYLSFVFLQMVQMKKENQKVEFDRLGLCADRYFDCYFSGWISKFCEEARKFAKTDFYNAVLDLTEEVIGSLRQQRLPVEV